MEHETICFTNEIRIAEDGWAMLAPFGDFPGIATELTPDGRVKSRRLSVQRVDRQAAQTMVDHFNSLGARVRRWLTGLPIFLGHPDAPGIGHGYAQKDSVGSISQLKVCEGGLYALPQFFNSGIEVLEKTRGLGFSARWGAEKIGEENGRTIYRPVLLKSAGLTDKPNLPVELLNEAERSASGSPAETPDMIKNKLIELLKKLGIEMSNDADDNALVAGCDALAARVQKESTDFANAKTTADGQITTLKTSLAERERERDTARADFANERKERLTLLLDQAQRDGRVTPTTRAEWEQKLGADFANAAEALGKITPQLKTQAEASNTARRQEFSNARDRMARVAELVNEAMQKTPGLRYPDAFARVQRENPGLFEAMKNPTK